MVVNLPDSSTAVVQFGFYLKGMNNDNVGSSTV